MSSIFFTVQSRTLFGIVAGFCGFFPSKIFFYTIYTINSLLHVFKFIRLMFFYYACYLLNVLTALTVRKYNFMQILPNHLYLRFIKYLDYKNIISTLISRPLIVLLKGSFLRDDSFLTFYD
jgi:hypothetical protein